MDEYNRIVEENKNLPEEQKKKFDISKLGNGIEFHGYDGENGEVDLSQAFTKSSFVFDGKDDYLTFPFNSESRLDGGFSIEFYGKFVGDGLHYDYFDKKTVTEKYMGILNILRKSSITEWGYEGNDFRFGFYFLNGPVDEVSFNFFSVNNAEKWKEAYTEDSIEKGWTQDDAPWNQRKLIDNPIEFNRDVYVSVIFDGVSNTEKLIIDGEIIDESKISSKFWETYESSLEIESNLPDTFILGAGNMGTTQTIHYANLKCYSLRLYNRPLTDDEIKESYKKTLSYHEFLEQN